MVSSDTCAGLWECLPEGSELVDEADITVLCSQAQRDAELRGELLLYALRKLYSSDVRSCKAGSWCEVATALLPHRRRLSFLSTGAAVAEQLLCTRGLLLPEQVRFPTFLSLPPN